MQLCKCQNGAICDPKDGSCECSPGWSGKKCDKACAPGTFGKDCSRKCDCADGMHCDPSDGECICPPGKKGHKCEETCVMQLVVTVHVNQDGEGRSVIDVSLVGTMELEEKNVDKIMCVLKLKKTIL